MSTQTVATLWAGIIAFAVLAYVVLDGFDLGVGMLFAVEPEPGDRDTMVNTIAPMWDGNETWLVLGGQGLLAVFPAAYAVIMPALYPTILGMLFGLIFRGVAFEFRFRAQTRAGRRIWDWSFFVGSLLAALCQGLTLGGLLQGIRVVNGQYAGGWFDWLTPFTVLCGVAVVFGYSWLGACWLVWRTDAKLQQRARHTASVLAVVMLALIVAVSLWTPFLNPIFEQRWFGWPGILFTAPVPVLVALLGGGLRLGDPPRAPPDAVPLRAGHLRAVLRRVGGEPLPIDGAAEHDHLAGRGAAGEPVLRAGRRRGAGAADLPLQRLQLLDLPRQGAGRCPLSLIPPAPGGSAWPGSWRCGPGAWWSSRSSHSCCGGCSRPDFADTVRRHG